MSEEQPGRPGGDEFDDGASGAAAPVGIDELAARELAALDEAPLAAHAEAYSRVHAALQRELVAIDGA